MRKNKFKIISFILSLFIIITLISFKNISVKANNIGLKPNFKITDLTVTQDSPMVGEYILVSGKIEPEDFETNIQLKEIVLVLDTSSSMSESVNSENDYSSTKIEELKKAAKSFIETMKDIPDLKIGIVAYSTEATINPYSYNSEKKEIKYINSDYYYEVPNYESYDLSFLDKEDSMLNTIIDNIKPIGEINVGEGLRKAIYMLDNGSKNADKTIVLMSNGKSTCYSVDDKKDFYNDIDNIYPNIAGVDSDTNTYAREYSEFMADIIKEKKYASYSIGYDISDDKDDFMKIHASMRDLLNENESTEENGFFEASDESIIEIFNEIAQNIKDSYELKNIYLDLKLNESFSMNTDKNEIKIGNIVYNEVSREIITGKVRYHAEPIAFNFNVKGNKAGDTQSILDNIDIKFIYNNENITITSKIDNLNVDIISSELPNIEANLIGDKIININENEEIKLRYEISPKSFSFNDENNIIKSNVIFVIDISKDMVGYMDSLVENLGNNILSNSNLKDMKTEYSIITYSNDAECITSNLESSKYDSYNDYILDLNKNYIKKLKVDNPNAKNLNTTYDLIKKLSINREKETNIIFISKDSNVSYGKLSDYKFLEDYGYNIITVEIENSNKNNNGTGNGNNKRDLKDLHNALNAEESNYFYCEKKEDLKDNILFEVANRIISNTVYKNYYFNPTLQIDLGESFEIVKEAKIEVNNTVNIKIPEIIYKYSDVDNIYNSENNSTIEFTIRAKKGEIGTLNLGTENKLIYKKLIENENKYSLVETPTIIVNQQIKDLTHGLYNGIVESKIDDKLLYKKVEIKENTIVNEKVNPLILAETSNLTMGSIFNTSSNSIKLSLDIDDNFEVVKTSDIIVYKVTNDRGIEAIERVGEENGSSCTIDYINGQANKFNISINEFNNKNEDIKILIVYKGTIKDNVSNKQLINKIEFGSGVFKDFIINISTDTEESPKLPDLF